MFSEFQLLNTKLEFNTTYMCVFTQEGVSAITNISYLSFTYVFSFRTGASSSRSNSIRIRGGNFGNYLCTSTFTVRSLYDIRNGCYTQADVNNGWKLTADASLKLNCNQEFTVIFSSVSRFDGDYILPLKKVSITKPVGVMTDQR